jgi:hypothetical protein
VSSSEEVQCVLILDLSSDNPISERSIEPHLPPSTKRRVYHVTAFGAAAAPQGGATTRRQWRDWTAAVDRVLERAREELGADGEMAHYYLAGRAALSLFAYLGLHLGKHARITMVNRRDDHTWDIVPFQHPPGAVPGEPDQERFFNVVEDLHLERPRTSDGMVAVFVSTQAELDEAAVRDFARSVHTSLAGIVTIRARPTGDASHEVFKVLGAGDGPRAARELVKHFSAIQNSYPHGSGLIVYIAGPVTLGAMVGRAMNPRVHSPVWLPYFRKPKYEPAVEIPWPLVSGGTPRILVLVANPPGAQSRLDSDRELRDMLDALRREMLARRCDLYPCPAARVEDLRKALRDFRPHLFHFIGHGDVFGLYLTGADGGQQFMSGDDLREMLVASGADDLHLVVFNACRSHDQAEKLVEVVDCAIGTRDEVLDRSAIQFAGCFYDDLVHGLSVADAFERARIESRVETSESRRVFEIYTRNRIAAKQLVFFSPATRDD